MRIGFAPVPQACFEVAAGGGGQVGQAQQADGEFAGGLEVAECGEGVGVVDARTRQKGVEEQRAFEVLGGFRCAAQLE